MQKIDRLAQRFAALTLPLALAACGGGGGSSPAPAPTPPAPLALSITGTAATGAAIAGGQVDAKCATGTASATTGTDGSFTLSVTGGSLPCVIKVSAGATELYSLAEGSGTEVHANVTPLTQLVAAQVAGGDPAALYASFDATAQAKVTSTAVADAITQVSGALAGTVDLTGVNPLTATFVVGDALDQKLDALGAALTAAQVSLADVSAALTANPGAPAPVVTLLKPAAASCSSLRSGTYRALNPNESSAEWNAQLITVDAAALTVTEHDGNVVPLTDKGGCLFEAGGGAMQFMVSRSGIAVVRDSSTTTAVETAVVLPEQSIPLADLAGEWNAVQYTRSATGQPLKPVGVTFTLDATGHVTAGNDCLGMAGCTPWTSLPGALQAAAGGGYTATSATAGTLQLFPFKTADGKVSMFIMPPAGFGFIVAAKQQSSTLPEVGGVTRVWDFTINGSGFASALSEMEFTVLTNDAATQSYTRSRTSDGRIDGFTIESPRAGLRHRAAGTSQINTGATVSFSEIIAMPLPGTGITVYTSVASNQNFFGVSVGKP
ncbi:hypothetical protein [Ideonella sp. BN130291]|uniref:hypothetical protein n=1 Tax=Ideonella sp. BN130291 TaxID=3112940 RepID=UPI002E270D17|nr:hypothetical protein [Ideonella sp. BN130291]